MPERTAPLRIAGSRGDPALTIARTVMMILCPLPIALLAAVYQESFLGVLLASVWGGILILVLRGVDDRWLRGIIVAGLLIRIPVVLTHLAIGFLVYGGALDFPDYFERAAGMGRELLSGNLEVLIVERKIGLAAQLGVFLYVLVGSSLPGMFLLSGMIGALGSYLFVRAFQIEFPSAQGIRFLALSLFFFPSLAFWTSLLGKDSWMFLALGWAAYSVARVSNSPSARHMIGFVSSAALVALIRPPMGVALVLVAGACVILSARLRLNGRAAILRPVAYGCFSLVVSGALVLTGSHMRDSEKISMSASVADSMLDFAVLKHVGSSTDAAGGSSVRVEFEEGRASFTAAAAFLPMAMFTFLFRPLVFEAHNLLAVLAALDSTLLLIVVLVRWRRLLMAISYARTRPFVAFCVLAFCVFTAALSFEANFGVIVRHRTMVLPFLFILLALPLGETDVRSRSSRGSTVGMTPSGEREG
jgi:hypothetical protein